MTQLDVIKGFEKINKKNEELNKVRDDLQEQRKVLDNEIVRISFEVEANGAGRQGLAKLCTHVDEKGKDAFKAFATSLYTYCKFCKYVR